MHKSEMYRSRKNELKKADLHSCSPYCLQVFKASLIESKQILMSNMNLLSRQPTINTSQIKLIISTDQVIQTWKYFSSVKTLRHAAPPFS